MPTKHPTIHALLIAILAIVSFIATGWSASRWLGEKKPEQIGYLVTWLTTSDNTSMTYRESQLIRWPEIKTFDDLEGVRAEIRTSYTLGTNAPIIFLLIKRFPL